MLQFQGSARDLCRELSYQERTQGGLINGAQVDAVTFVLTHIGQRFVPLSEEQRLQAYQRVMSFDRNPNETIDAMLTRFATLRFRAAQGGNGVTMSWEGYSWLLLKACRPNQQQLVNILQPFQMNFPNNEQQFNAMSTTLRRLGHILEGSSMNIASQLKGNPQQQSFMATYSPQQSASSGQPQTFFTGDDLSDTDTATASTDGDPDYSSPSLVGRSGPEIDAELFWQY